MERMLSLREMTQKEKKTPWAESGFQDPRRDEPSFQETEKEGLDRRMKIQGSQPSHYTGEGRVQRSRARPT